MTPGSDRSECEIITAAMVARGIPDTIILREDRAKNTGENVIFSLPVIDAALGLANIRSVICLGSWTARRYPMTLHRHWPEVEKMLVMVDCFRRHGRSGTPIAEFSLRMLHEWDKIEPYKARGFIAEWPVAKRAAEAATTRWNRRLFFRGQHSRERAQRQIELLGAGGAERQAHRVGGMAGVTAKVVDGVSATSRRAAAATKVCERQCGGNVSQRW